MPENTPKNEPEDPWPEQQETVKPGATPATEPQFSEFLKQQRRRKDIPPPPPSAPVPPDEANPKLFRRTDRLARFHRWLNEDPEMAEIFDSVLKEQVKAASRRQALISVAVAIVSLIVGWLLNAINPVSIANLLHH